MSRFKIGIYTIYAPVNDSVKLYFLVNDDGMNRLESIPFPSYSNLKNILFSKKATKNEKDKKGTFNWFKIICWSIASILSFLSVLDFIGLIMLTTERLITIAVIIGLILVPFTKKLNILGIELERLIDANDKKYN